MLSHQHPADVLDYEVEWGKRLGTDTILTSTWASEPALTFSGQAINDDITVAFVQGGVHRQTYNVTNTITTGGGRTYTHQFHIRFTTAPQMLTASSLREDFLGDMKLEDARGRPIPNRKLEMRIQAARAVFERTLSIRLEPTIIKVGRYALPNEPKADEEYVGADYIPDQERGQHLIHLPIAPIRQVLHLALRHPMMVQPLILPVGWAHPSPNRPSIRVLPTVPNLNIYPTNVLSTQIMLSSNNTEVAPQAWQVVYEAGYTALELESEFADVITNLGKAAALEALSPGSIDRFMAQGIGGQSASVDGLSQSVQLIASAANTKFAPIMRQYADELTAWKSQFLENARGMSSRIFVI